MRRLLTGLALWCFAVAAHASISVTPSPSTGTHTVSWAGTPPPNFVRYELKESFNGGTAALVYSGTATSRLLTGRAPGSYTYTFDVCQTFYIFGSPVVLCLPALNPDLTPQQATVTVTNAPPVPGPISGPGTDTDGAYTIAWGSSTGATSYELQEQVNGAAWSTIQNTAATSKALSGKTNATYGYQVRACNGTACSAYTAVHNVQVLNTPSAPGPITGPTTDPDGSYTIAWTAAAGSVDRYELEERVNAGSFALIQSSLALDKSFTGKINNSYGYQVRACNALSCGNYTAIHSVIVTDNPGDPNQPNPAPAPELADFPAYNSASDAIALLPGSFRVDESGAATYSIPIGTVAGSGGVAPVVSLDYSSQGGNGVVGVGFRLSGASVITRCRQTQETDNTAMGAVTFTSTDRFCLDGARLVLMSGNYGAPGAAYRTEIDSFTKVVSNGSQGGGPQSFTVWRKDGSVTEYGVTDDARIEAFGTDSAVFAWAQNKFSDSAGNYLEFEYLEDTSNGIEFVLDTIRYTGNDNALTSPFAELRFLYDDTRPDKTRGYFAGMALKQTRRVTDIESWASPPSGGAMTLIERTTLDYEAAPSSNLSRMTSVTRCGPTVCLEPTTFTWQDAGGGFEASATETYHTRYFRGGKPADIDGDGDADLVWLRLNNAGEPKIEIMRSENGQLISQGQEFGANSAEAASWQILDYNNDGRHDVISAWGSNWQVWLGTVDTYGNPTLAAPINTLIPIDGYNRTAVADFDGNGLADMVYTNAGALYWRLLNKSGSNYAFGTAQALTIAPAPGGRSVGVAIARCDPSDRRRLQRRRAGRSVAQSVRESLV